ncbi:unnamed protein product [Oppiella nova]|uniref:Uncharacterized protein n=1 Tax=Oppiella nova TaxID=334625 RepID=A0A7R9QHZ4_9ACAR|nr:unnamed protein product [Oppiella nova]CAG2166136.1 unnamed protein product [Oppiella nova]
MEIAGLDKFALAQAANLQFLFTKAGLSNIADQQLAKLDAQLILGFDSQEDQGKFVAAYYTIANLTELETIEVAEVTEIPDTIEVVKVVNVIAEDKHQRKIRAVDEVDSTDYLATEEQSVTSKARNLQQVNINPGIDKLVEYQQKHFGQYTEKIQEPTQLKRYRRSDSDDERENNRKLFSAISKGKVQKVEELLNSGVQVNVVDKNNKDNTPLHYAIEKNKKEIVKLLLKQQGININAKNDKGKTPRDLARDQNNQEILDMLEEHLQKHSSSGVDSQQQGSQLISAGTDQQVAGGSAIDLPSIQQSPLKRKATNSDEEDREKDIEADELLKVDKDHNTQWQEALQIDKTGLFKDYYYPLIREMCCLKKQQNLEML